MKVVQCTLISGNAKLVSWLDSRPDLRAGVFVTLKDEEPERRWKVESVGEVVMEKDEVSQKGHSQAFFKRDMHRKNGGWENC